MHFVFPRVFLFLFFWSPQTTPYDVVNANKGGSWNRYRKVRGDNGPTEAAIGSRTRGWGGRPQAGNGARDIDRIVSSANKRTHASGKVASLRKWTTLVRGDETRLRRQPDTRATLRSHSIVVQCVWSGPHKYAFANGKSAQRNRRQCFWNACWTNTVATDGLYENERARRSDRNHSSRHAFAYYRSSTTTESTRHVKDVDNAGLIKQDRTNKSAAFTTAVDIASGNPGNSERLRRAKKSFWLV